MSEFEKHFTLEQARAALPELRRKLLRLQNLLADLQRENESAGRGGQWIMRGNGKGPILLASGAKKEEAQSLIESIAEQGIQIKDLETGLVDFPHFLSGDPDREVFLCWKLGEVTIEYWHELSTGYGGRQPL